MQKAFDSNKEKIKVTSLEIIVTGTKDKPYYEIKYKEVGEEDYHTGYSSYDLNNVFEWKEECFEIVNQVAEEYKTDLDFAEKCVELAEKMNVCDLVAENQRLSRKIMFLEAEMKSK